MAKKGLIILTSAVLVVLVFWFLVLGKIKIPKSKEELAEAGKDVLGTAEEVATSKFFETSEVTEPLRQMRETVMEKINETITSIRELPEREIMTIKKEVCKQWLEQIE